MTQSSLGFTIAVVQEKAKGAPELRKLLSGKKMAAFSSDLSLVAHSIRTGYLLDIFSPQNPIDLFSRLLNDLRGDPRTGDCFASVFHLYEPSSDQSVFVNTTLLSQRIEVFNKPEISSALQGNVGLRPIFVHLGTTFEIIETPAQIVQLLASLLELISTSPTPLSHPLPNDIPVETAVALAAILLDYPVAYVPSVSHQNALSGMPLDFYECFLAFLEEKRKDDQEQREIICSVMKFSCPAELAHSRSNEYPGLQPQSMIKNLRDMFQNRIRNLNGMRITAIEHCTRTLDQVAF